jgi:3' exoribonuclease, RNase T-like
MKYFIDTEFKEQPNTIELISIGIVAEDGRQYYAINKDVNLRKIWKDEWIRENVLKSIYKELLANLSSYAKIAFCRYHGFSRIGLSRLILLYGKPLKQIASEIIDFINPREQTYEHGIGLDKVIYSITRADCWNEVYYKEEFSYIKKHNTHIPDRIYGTGFDGKGTDKNKELIYNQPEFYGYYADYDWLVFCWLFGRMIDLPKGFPMYCKDIKQMLDDNALTKQWKRQECPDPEGEHNALLDAIWNKNLYEKIMYFKSH